MIVENWAFDPHFSEESDVSTRAENLLFLAAGVLPLPVIRVYHERQINLYVGLLNRQLSSLALLQGLPALCLQSIGVEHHIYVWCD